MIVQHWPATLPNNLLVDGYSQASANVMLRTSMDVGPAKVRRRFTAGVQPIAGQQEMTLTELGTFRGFYHNTLHGGSLRFVWRDPVTHANVEMRFTEPPTWTALGGLHYMVSMSLEILP